MSGIGLLFPACSIFERLDGRIYERLLIYTFSSTTYTLCSKWDRGTGAVVAYYSTEARSDGCRRERVRNINIMLNHFVLPLSNCRAGPRFRGVARSDL